MIFSVIVPTYNRVFSLKRTLESLFGQDFSDFEIIVVDDGSDDGTDEYLKTLEQQGKIQYIRLPRRGPAAARTNGLKKARGQFVAFTDDDCVVPFNWLSQLHQIFESTGTDIIGGSVKNCLENNIYSEVGQAIINHFVRSLNQNGRSSPFLTSNNIAYRAEVIKKVGGFDERFDKAGGEERALNYKILLNGGKSFYAADLVVEHYHQLTAFGFFRQQLNYGKGSYVLYKVVGKELAKPPKLIPLSVYVSLGLSLLKDNPLIGLRKVGLLILAHLTVFLGFSLRLPSRSTELRSFARIIFARKIRSMESRREKRITLLFINLYVEMGGGEYSIYNLLKAIDRTRFRPIMMFNKRGPFVDKVKALGVEVVFIPNEVVILKKLLDPRVFWRNLKVSFQIKSFLKSCAAKGGIDIIQCSDVLSLLLLFPSLLRFHIPVVYSVIMFYDRARSWLFNLLALFFVKQIVTNSKAVRDDLLKKTIGLERKTSVVYNGVDSTVFYPRPAKEKKKIRQGLGLPVDKKIVGFIGRYDPCKGHVTFLEAAKRLLNSRDDIFFLVVGGAMMENIVPEVPRYRKMVMERINAIQFDGRLEVWDHRDDVPEIMASLDVFVCPSDYEGFGMAVLEALASGVPVVVSRTVGALEVVSDENGVFIAEPKDALSFAKRIAEALEYAGNHRDDSSKRSSIASSHAWMTECSWRQYGRCFEELYSISV